MEGRSGNPNKIKIITTYIEKGTKFEVDDKVHKLKVIHHYYSYIKGEVGFNINSKLINEDWEEFDPKEVKFI